MRKTFKSLITLVATLVSFGTCIAQNPHQSTDNMNNNTHRDAVYNMAILDQYTVFKGSTNIRFAFITGPETVEIFLNDGFQPADNNVIFNLYDYSNGGDAPRFPLKEVFRSTCVIEGHKAICNNLQLDLNSNYTVTLGGETVNVYLSPEIGGILDTRFDATAIKNFGVSYSGTDAHFKLWSPPAGRVELLLFDKNQQALATTEPLLMTHTGKGVWERTLKAASVKGINSLDGLYYQYKVYAYGEARLALDPYAKSMAAFDTTSHDRIGKAAIVDMNAIKSKPAIFKRNYTNAAFTANELDMVAYEIHVRDFTIQPDVVEPEVAGTFKGFIQKIPHIKNLGITHVQFLPVNNFYTVSETDREYKKGTTRVGNYNWGYDPHNYFTLEGWFATDANNPYTRIKEYRELVQALHDKGIGVIMDVVYNHLYIAETFENAAPGCYHRFADDYRISGKTGAGPSFETRRLMARKLIIESLVHFVEMYHVDGFRFDLMGFMDHETMLAIRQEVGKVYNPANIHELILQGEAWVFSDLNTDTAATGRDAATTKLNYPNKGLSVAFFNDSSRDSYTGREHNKGFVQGIYKEGDRVATGIIAGLIDYNAGDLALNSEIFNDTYNRFADAPATCLNYLSIHDGYTLWDKINLSVKDITKAERARLMRFASAMLFTSQGKIILHGGDELLRSKPLSTIDKESHRAHTTEFTDEEEGTVYFHENTYCSHDYTNMLRWDRLVNEYHEFSTGMVDYYKGLIQMRRQLPCLRYKNAESIRQGLKFLGDESQGAGTGGYYKSFADERLNGLHIEFINGPLYERFHVAGEVYPQGIDANPSETDLLYIVDFDGNGKASLLFTQEQIRKFDLGKWGEGQSLNIKLVKTPGQWDTPHGAYTGMGNNVIKISGIDKSGKVIINLSVADYAAGDVPRTYAPYVAYVLDNTLEKDIIKSLPPTLYTKLIVVHNASPEAVTVEAPDIENPGDWVVICDANNAGVKPLKFSPLPTSKKGETNVLIEDGKVFVPYKSTTVIAKKK